MGEYETKEHDAFEGKRRQFTALLEIERDEQNEETGGWVIFDGFARTFSDEQIFDLLALRTTFNSLAKLFSGLAEYTGQWVSIEVASHAAAHSIPAEVVMFGDNTESIYLHITSLTPAQLEPDEYRMLTLSGEARTPATFIAAILDFSLRASGDLAAAAYDVGQGNCNAIVDQYEHPRVFFDLGWAPNFHSFTRPPSQPDFFACDRRTVAPVVLSHWDMDHWSYAIKRSAFNPTNLTTKHEWNAQALQRFWIGRAPQTKAHQIGPLAMSFYRELTKVHLFPGIPAMLLWPNNCRRIDFSEGWLEACDPPSHLPQDRNNTGIAMFVQPNRKGPAILMTGDADFPSIPSLQTNKRLKLAGMIAPHHGSRITVADVPKPLKRGPKKLVLSVGNGNVYGHPKQESIDAYQAKGWDWDVVATHQRQTCPHTVALFPATHSHLHGNVLLKFSPGAPDPKCGCGQVRQGNLCLIPSHVVTSCPPSGTRKTYIRKKKTAVVP
ncbi:hypothetical protein YA0783_20255 [Pseudomonas corrugata]|uniref:hypothetical protein n=1 Tax=Pseudomonas corrugata TaxID=47879 RepID=UPI0018E5F222|nr:hypothetical protein [Pseudomonas corrugata]MBI6620639.1 hypothetical protein [Pseudomonas corrugata]MBI6690850.1 hypothetical protein [Pseudomonas corrugata]